VIEDIINIKSTKKELREFGLTVGIILAILSGAVFLWGRRPVFPYLFGTASTLIILGLVLPRILKPFQKVWMGFSIIMGFFVSRIILFILFFLVLTPLGLAARLFGKDILDQKIDKNRASYWHERSGEAKDKKSYENQY